MAGSIHRSVHQVLPAITGLGTKPALKYGRVNPILIMVIIVYVSIRCYSINSMLHRDTLTVDYRKYKPSEDLSKGRLIEVDGIQMHVVGESEKTIVVPRAFQAYSGGALEQLRDRVLADVLKARIISIDIPGIGLNQSAQSSDKWMDEAKQGSLASRSKAMIEGLVKGFELEELNLIGYSLGAWATAAIVANPALLSHNLKIGSVNLVEPVNDQNWGYLSVIKAIKGEFGRAGRYKRETSKHFPTLPPRIHPENGSSLKPESTKFLLEEMALGRGLSVGFAPMLAEAIKKDSASTTGLSTAPFTIYRANGSSATRPQAVETTLDMLAKSGHGNLSYYEIIHPPKDKSHHHLLWHSMGAVAMLAAHIGSERN